MWYIITEPDKDVKVNSHTFWLAFAILYVMMGRTILPITVHACGSGYIVVPWWCGYTVSACHSAITMIMLEKQLINVLPRFSLSAKLKWCWMFIIACKLIHWSKVWRQCVRLCTCVSGLGNELYLIVNLQKLS